MPKGTRSSSASTAERISADAGGGVHRGRRGGVGHRGHRLAEDRLVGGAGRLAGQPLHHLGADQPRAGPLAGAGLPCRFASDRLQPIEGFRPGRGGVDGLRGGLRRRGGGHEVGLPAGTSGAPSFRDAGLASGFGASGPAWRGRAGSGLSGPGSRGRGGTTIETVWTFGAATAGGLGSDRDARVAWRWSCS